MDDFTDILHHPHYALRKHSPMQPAARAAQFAAFAALSGFDEDIGEAARLTDFRTEMTEDDLAELDAAFNRLRRCAQDRPLVTVICFQPDKRKAGGAYRLYTGQFRHYDAAADVLYFTDGTALPRQMLCAIYM